MKKSVERLLAGVSAGLIMSHAVLAAEPSDLVILPSPDEVLAPPQRESDTTGVVPQLREDLGLPDGAAQQQIFIIKNIRVEGNTVFSDAKVTAQLGDLMNRKASLDEVKAALDGINKLYQETGYALGRAYIPPQMLSDGTLIVRIVEGYIGRIILTHETGSESLKHILDRFARRITEERPLKSETLERYLLLMSDLPGMKISAQLVAMNVYTGAAILKLTAEQKSVTFETALNTRSNLDDLPVQAYFTTSLNNMMGQGDQLSVTALLSPYLRTQRYFRGMGSWYLGSDGLRLVASLSNARAMPDDLPAGLGLIGDAKRADIYLRYPVIRAKEKNLNVSLGIYAMQSYNELNSVRITEDAGRVIYVGGDYSTLIGRTAGFSANVQMSKGFDIFGAGPDRKRHSRIGAAASFVKIRGAANLNYRFLESWTIGASFQGQYSGDSLFSSEEIGFGGSRFGRGFDPAEITGDSGYGVSIQLKHDFQILAEGGLTVSPYAFADHSKVYNTPKDRQGDDRLVSAGVGVAISNHSWFTIGLEVAKPLNKPRYYTDNRHPRFYLSLGATF